MWHKTQRTENLFGRRKYLPDPAPPARTPASVPGGTVGYPAQPRLIAESVSPLSDITFNYSAGNRPGPTNGEIFFENCELTRTLSRVFFEMNS
jgi:hypothetical protein